MTLYRFSTPVLAHLPLKSGRTRLQALNGPREALHAIHKDGLGGFRFESVNLARTMLQLARAVQEPTREMLEEAREAVVALAALEPPPAAS
jgi:hypothetical protein